MSDQIGGGDQQLEGAAAKLDRTTREQRKTLFEKMQDPRYQTIVIMLDLNGQESVHVHIEGSASKNKLAIYGMLEVARDCAAMSS